MKKTKIICTIGPASSSPKVIEELAEAGMDIIRLNLSHGDYASREKVIAQVRALSKKLDRPIGVMVDLQGPKIRVGELKRPITLKKGETIILTHKPGELEPTKYTIIPVQEDLRASLRKDDPILINDGKIRIKVERVQGLKVWCSVINGGEVSTHKG